MRERVGSSLFRVQDLLRLSACTNSSGHFTVMILGLRRQASCLVFGDVLRFQKEGVETNDRPQNYLKGVKDQIYVGRGHGRKLVLGSLDRDDTTGWNDGRTKL